MRVAPSPWPGLTGHWIILVRDSLLLSNEADTPFGYMVFGEEEIRRLCKTNFRSVANVIAWKGEGGMFLGDEKTYRDNLTQLRGKDAVDEYE